jgi:hypothetical protein
MCVYVEEWFLSGEYVLQGNESKARKYTAFWCLEYNGLINVL